MDEVEENIKIIEWFNEHQDELDLKEKLESALAFNEYAKKLKAIYEKHNATTFVVKWGKDK